MKPVVVVTVYRRYHELARTLQRVRELAHEFSEPPDVVVVWSQPEVGRLWFFQRLLDDGTVQKLLTRPRLPGEAADAPTTYPESHNLRLGLEWVRDNYDPSSTYAVVQAADVLAKPEAAYKFVDANMREGAGAVVFHWQNGCVPVEIWHTNFFAVRLDEPYWPPVSGPDNQDVLEHQWGRKLCELRPPGVVKTHNYNEKRFAHAHTSEREPEWPVVPQSAAASPSPAHHRPPPLVAPRPGAARRPQAVPAARGVVPCWPGLVYPPVRTAHREKTHMAKMTVEFDTETKKFTAAIDGKEVPNVRAAEIYPSYDADDEYRCAFITKSTDDGTGITEVRQLFAARSAGAARALARNDGRAFHSVDFPGFVEDRDALSESKSLKTIAAAFGYKE